MNQESGSEETSFFFEETSASLLGIPTEIREMIFMKINVWELLNIAHTCKALKKEAIETFKKNHKNSKIEIIQYQRKMYAKKRFKFSYYYFYYKNLGHARAFWPPYIIGFQPHNKYETIFNLLELFGPFMENLVVLFDKSGYEPLIAQVKKCCPKRTYIKSIFHLNYIDNSIAKNLICRRFANSYKVKEQSKLGCQPMSPIYFDEKKYQQEALAETEKNHSNRPSFF